MNGDVPKGHGADAVRVVRAMFELQIGFKYLLLYSGELQDFLDFDAVARWRRQQFYKSQHPGVYATFSEPNVSEVEREFKRVHKRFRSWTGKLRDQWCKHPLPEMARRTGLADMYSLFYGYSTLLQTLDPMGLGMMIHAKSGDVQSPPTVAHVGIALAVGNRILLDTLRGYSKLCQIDKGDAFQAVEQDLAKANIDVDSSAVGDLRDVIDHL